MFLITNKDNNRIVMWGEVLDYMENGYPRLVDEDTAFYPEAFIVHEDVTIEEGVEPGKYSYTAENGFYVSATYVEPNNPYGLSNELYNTIRDEAIAEIEEAVINGIDE